MTSSQNPAELKKISTSIRWAADGLRRGLTRYAGQVQVAAIVGYRPTSELYVFDETDMLSVFDKQLGSLFTAWPASITGQPNLMPPHEYCEDDGKLCQAWFVKTDQQVSSPIIREWLKAAANRMKVQFARRDEGLLDQQTRREMEGFARVATAEYIQGKRAERLGQEATIDVYEILQDIARVSVGTEEGKRATGTIAFIEPAFPISDGKGTVTIGAGFPVVAELQDVIRLKDYKHVVKSLQVVAHDGCLYGDEYGIAAILPEVPEDALVASFQRGAVHLSYHGEHICQIVNGEFFYPRLADPITLMTPVFTACGVTAPAIDVIKSVIESCTRGRHGSSIAVVPSMPLTFPLSGHSFKSPLLAQAVAQSLSVLNAMSAVDGALLLDFVGSLYGFGFMFDGQIDPNTAERRSRGARFNSAIRFSQKIPAGFVIVASEDGPVTLFQNGKALFVDPLNEPDAYKPPFGWHEAPSFQVWLSASPKPQQAFRQTGMGMSGGARIRHL